MSSSINQLKFPKITTWVKLMLLGRHVVSMLSNGISPKNFQLLIYLSCINKWKALFPCK